MHRNQRWSSIVTLVIGMCVSTLLLNNFILVTNAQEAKVGLFSVKAVLPENQKNSDVSYFDLSIAPKQKQSIQVLVKNTSAEPIIVYSQVHAASTGQGGVISYNVPNVQDESMEYSMEDIATIETTEIELEAQKSTYITIQLMMPENSFDGVVLGGIFIHADTVAKKSKATEPGIDIENKMAYIIGLKLTETDVEVKPDMHLLDIYPTNAAMTTAMAIRLQNSKAVIMKDVNVDASIYSSNSSQVLYSSTNNQVEIAPNSNFEYLVDWQNKQIEPGKYRLQLRIDYEDYTWQWDEEFEIFDTNIVDVNKAPLVTKPTPWLLITSSILLLLLGLLYIAYRIGRRKQNS